MVACDDLKWGQVPVVVYERNNLNESIENIRNYCKQVLPKFMIPKHFIPVNQIPLLANKKPNYDDINNLIRDSIA